MAFVTGYFALFLQGSYSATDADKLEIENLKGVFQKKVSPITIINFNSLFFSQEQFQLLNPIYALPDSRTNKSTNYSTKGNCFKGLNSLINRGNFEKVWVWEEFRCGRRKNLPRSFFVEPPFMHPSGFSYPMLALRLGKNSYNNKIWVQNHLPYFHISELGEIRKSVGELRGVFSILEKLDEESLVDVSEGKGTVLSEDFLFAKLSYPKLFNILEYRVYAKKDLDKYLLETPYVLHNFESGKACFYKDGTLCWEYNVKHIFRLANKGTLIFFAGLIIIIVLVVRIILIKIRQQKIEDEKRRLALRVLTHEFRTPIASLLLLIERFSRRFDDLDEDLQDSYLRISSEIYRLQRLTETSRNYLKAKQSGKLITFNLECIKSVNHWVEESLVNYFDRGDEFEFVPLKNDEEFKIDTYWLGICIKNLVENAFHHGSTPVRVSLFMEKGNLLIKVSDRGECSFSDIEDMSEEFVKGNKSEGTGLGLNIVYKVIREWGGDLTFEANPTTFTIELPNKKVKNGQDSIS